MTYDYRGKKITLDDKLVKEYKRVWFSKEPDQSLFDRYISSHYESDNISEIIKHHTDKELNEIINDWITVEINDNK